MSSALELFVLEHANLDRNTARRGGSRGRGRGGCRAGRRWWQQQGRPTVCACPISAS
jgi:hypothetical protein